MSRLSRYVLHVRPAHPHPTCHTLCVHMINLLSLFRDGRHHQALSHLSRSHGALPRVHVHRPWAASQPWRTSPAQGHGQQEFARQDWIGRNSRTAGHDFPRHRPRLDLGSESASEGVAERRVSEPWSTYGVSIQ